MAVVVSSGLPVRVAGLSALTKPVAVYVRAGIGWLKGTLTFFAVIIDSFLFCFIAFYGAMQTSDILNMIYVQIAIKVCFAFFNILPAYGARSLFKRYITGDNQTQPHAS